jgi:hypothetical protein
MASTSNAAATGAATRKLGHSRTRVPGLPARLRSDAEFFEPLKDDLLGRPGLTGTFVAVYRRQMVGSDPDELALFQRMTAKYGDVPFFIGRVERCPRVKRIPSPRVFRRAP